MSTPGVDYMVYYYIR